MNEWQALGLAVCCGIGYNWLVGRHNRPELTLLWVVLGCALTLALSTLVEHQTVRLAIEWHGRHIVLTNSQHAAVFELKFFVVTGLPMIIGSLWRHYRRL